MSGYAIVLAGGTGTRLWPYSRRSRPKQLLPLLGERSMLQATVARLAPLVTPDRVIIVTNAEYVDQVRAQAPEVPADQVVGEPQALGTAAAIGLGAAIVAARDADATMFVLPADHVISPPERFRDDLRRAAAVAATGRLVTFGIRPDKPETGYGYVELGLPLDGEAGAHDVVRFVEKPDRATAVRWLAEGRHVWNSGMFAWTMPAIQDALDRHLPDLGAHVREIAEAARAGGAGFEPALADVWSRITDHTTIDYGIMEPSDRVACVPATFDWSDVGSWAALADAIPADADGNVVVGRHVGHDTADTLVYGIGDRLVATVGLRDMIIVDTEDALLVCPRDRAQEVREIVARLREGDDGLLQ